MSLEGQQIGRYRILRLLGSGGMGEVYLAEDARIEQQVAIKVIRAEVSPYPGAQATQEAARLFQREARAIVKLDHPHILPLFDYGEERIGNQTVIYLVMPYRSEGSLADWLRQRGQQGLLSPQEVAHIVGQAASALQHAHDRQIVHQDVKPSNFLLRLRQETPTRPDLLLADFGIARLSTASASASQSIRGTPTSMAPEQWEGHPVAATDQYALAVMAYELLTGRPPFQGAPGPLMYQHLMVPPPPPGTFNARLSRDIDTVLLHALAKKPEERFLSITAFANAFQQAVQGMQGAQTPTRIAAAPTSPTPSDIRAVLAISLAEAEAGTTRTLTLPGGRKVTVPVPAGVRDGQLVRLEGQGAASPDGGEAGVLILTILVAAAQEPPALSPASATGAEETLLTADPTALATSAPTVSDTGQQPMVSNAARPELSTPTDLDISPTEAATPASQPSSPSTEAALPTKPSLGRPEEMLPVTRVEQRTGAAPVEQPVQPPATVTPQPSQRGISRRTVVIGLAGLAVVGVAGGGLLWLARSQQTVGNPKSPTVTPTHSLSPTTTSSATTSPTTLTTPVGTLLYTYRGQAQAPYGVSSAVWSPDGTRIASSAGTVQIWDATDGGNVLTRHAFTNSYNNSQKIAWSLDGTRIVSIENLSMEVWTAKDGAFIAVHHSPLGWGDTVSWSPDNQRIVSGSDEQPGSAEIWNAASGKTMLTYRGHVSPVLAAAWSPNGKWIASSSMGRLVHVWDATNANPIYIYGGHPVNEVSSVAWSPESRRVASAGNDGTVHVWDASNGDHVYIYRGHFHASDQYHTVTTVAWSPDGTRIASGDWNHLVQIWDAASGKQIYIYKGHSDYIESVAWSPDGKRIASASRDGTVQVWQASS